MEKKQLKTYSEIVSPNGKNNGIGEFGLPKENNISIEDLNGKQLIIKEKIEKTFRHGERMVIRFSYIEQEDTDYYTITGSATLKDRLGKVKESDYPFVGKIVKNKSRNGNRYFTIE